MPDLSDELFVTPINWLNTFFSGWVGRLFVALLILIIGFILGKLAEKLVHLLLKELKLVSLTKRLFGPKVSSVDAISKLPAYVIYFVALVTALNKIGVTQTLFYVVALVLALLLIVSLVMGIRDFIPNYIAGIFRKASVKAGDNITVGGIRGKVTKVHMTEVEVETEGQDVICIPNSYITNHRLTIRKKA